MNSTSPIILQLALRSLLVKKLQRSILLLTGHLSRDEKTNQGLNALIQTIDLPLQTIPIKLIKHPGRIEYGSAIAFKLSKSLGISVIRLVDKIQARLTNIDLSADQENNHLPLERVWKNFKVQINPSGWISLQLNETGTALWLQLLVNSIRAGDCPTINQGYETDIHQLGNFTNSSFIIQYTHARCCSLLHLAHQAELIELDNAQPHWRQSVPLIAVPNSLPWLDAEHRLRFQQITEWQLITQCVVTLDRLAELASSDVVTLNRAVDFKLAMELSQTFQAFHAACPLLGEAQKASLELAQVRLGLISVTQGLLNLLLQEGIGVMAPVCL